MDLQQFIADDSRAVRTVEDADEHLVVADLGPAVEGTVDVVDDTAIVVLEDDETFDIDLPGAPEGVFIRNGVLTIELEEEA